MGHDPKADKDEGGRCGDEQVGSSADFKCDVKEKSKTQLPIIDDKDRDGPELFIALIGPMGTDLKAVFKSFEKILKGIDYISKKIKLSDVLRTVNVELPEAGSCVEEQRIELYMEAGDKLREMTGRGDIVASLGIIKIRELRSELKAINAQYSKRTVYIIDSLKHPEEVNKLRNIYGDSLVIVSVHRPKSDRIEHLSSVIAKTHNKIDKEQFRSEAERLIKNDHKSSGDFRQNVMETFPLADFFIDQKNDIDPQIKRFVELLFGNSFITPTIDEYGMFFAQAAALRSSDLSRQVGVMITTKAGEVVAAGCNEVPEAGGGHAWEGNTVLENDHRDFRLGQDANAVMKHEIVSEILDALIKRKWLVKEFTDMKKDDLLEKALYDNNDPPLRGTRVTNIIEFGRIIHAEMSAITDAARRGISVKGTTLYCTTFPCHMCARHIIAAGIARVVYIEPYEKSATKTLYGGAIKFDDTSSSHDKVVFHPFIGVAPTIYHRLFSMLSRKDRKTGYKEEWGSRDLVPRISGSYKAYLANEVAVLDRVNKAREMAAKAGTMNQSAGAGDGAAGDVAPGSAGAGAAPGATQ